MLQARCCFLIFIRANYRDVDQPSSMAPVERHKRVNFICNKKCLKDFSAFSIPTEDFSIMEKTV